MASDRLLSKWLSLAAVLFIAAIGGTIARLISWYHFKRRPDGAIAPRK